MLQTPQESLQYILLQQQQQKKQRPMPFMSKRQTNRQEGKAVVPEDMRISINELQQEKQGGSLLNADLKEQMMSQNSICVVQDQKQKLPSLMNAGAKINMRRSIEPKQVSVRQQFRLSNEKAVNYQYKYPFMNGAARAIMSQRPISNYSTANQSINNSRQVTRQIADKTTQSSHFNNTIKSSISEATAPNKTIEPKQRLPSAQRPQPQLAYSLAKKRSPSPPQPHRSRSRQDENPNVKGFKGNLLLQARRNKSPIKDAKKKESALGKKKDLTELAPVQRRFVIVEQENYNKWIENKKTGLSSEVKLGGELSVIRPKSKKKPAIGPSSRMVKKLSDHSLTKMTKRSFKPKAEKSACKTKPLTPRESPSASKRKRPQTAQLSPNKSLLHHNNSQSRYNGIIRQTSELHVCARHQWNHTTKEEIIEENKKLVGKLAGQIKDLKKSMYDSKHNVATEQIQASARSLNRFHKESMSGKYDMQQLDYKKEFRDAPIDAKVDMIYKVYWNPKKWVKPLEQEQQLQQSQ